MVSRIRSFAHAVKSQAGAGSHLSLLPSYQLWTVVTTAQDLGLDKVNLGFLDDHFMVLLEAICSLRKSMIHSGAGLESFPANAKTGLLNITL